MRRLGRRPLRELGVLSGIWAVISFWGGPLDELGVHMSGILAVGFFWGGPLSELEVHLPGMRAIFSSSRGGSLSEFGGPGLQVDGAQL